MRDALVAGRQNGGIVCCNTPREEKAQPLTMQSKPPVAIAAWRAVAQRVFVATRMAAWV